MGTVLQHLPKITEKIVSTDSNWYKLPSKISIMKTFILTAIALFVANVNGAPGEAWKRMDERSLDSILNPRIDERSLDSILNPRIYKRSLDSILNPRIYKISLDSILNPRIDEEAARWAPGDEPKENAGGDEAKNRDQR